MITKPASKFRFTTSVEKPEGYEAGVVFVDEDDEYTGIYKRYYPSGDLWPMRTVRVGTEKYEKIINAWMLKQEIDGIDFEDYRGQDIDPRVLS